MQIKNSSNIFSEDHEAAQGERDKKNCYFIFCVMFVISNFLLLIIVSIQGKTFLISDYGACPNDSLDDTKAIQLAINDAISHGLDSDVIFGYGIYSISSTIAIQNATNLTIKGQGIDQTFLIGINPIGIFSAHFCNGLTLVSFSIDYDPLRFTAGYVVNVDRNFLDIQVVPPHRTDVGQRVHGLHRYNPVQMRPDFGPNTYGVYQRPPADNKTTILSPGILRLPLAAPLQFVEGDPIVARYVFTDHAIYAVDVIDFTIQSLAIYSSWSMGIVTLRVRRFNILNYQVRPRDGRWLSQNQDAMHFVDTREYITITDSVCEAMGDDALNVHATFLLITEIINSTAATVTATNGTTILDIGVGTNVEFSSYQQPYTVHGNGTIASVIFNSINTRNITFTTPVNLSVNDWMCVADAPFLTIRNLTVANNRARAVLTETRNVDIRQSIFNRTSGPAVLIQPSMYWKEGPAARNVTLSENIYFENNEGITQEKAIISILPDPIQSIPVFNDILIESSTFYFGIYSQGFLQSDNANNVFIHGNYIVTNNLTSFISICNSRNISAIDNCIVTNQTRPVTYYVFDTTASCIANSSSLINLPSSAFNSSFPPPVLVKK